MKFNEIVLSCILLVSISKASQAASSSQGQGRVNMQGSITETACAIATGSREQTFDMDIIPIGDIIRDGQGLGKPFDVELIYCDLSPSPTALLGRSHFAVTFDGDADGALFGVKGEARGVALEITDSQGNKAVPGEVLPKGELKTGTMKLKYTMKLVSNNQKLQAGKYISVVRFKLDYY